VQRKELLQVESCQKIAENVLHDFQKLQPEFSAAQPVEIHMYRRGHPMFLPTPGTFTKTIPTANQPLERIVFANTDSVGPVSDVSGAVEAAHHAAEWVEKKMAAGIASAARSAGG
jgi:monoamine oxidase